MSLIKRENYSPTWPGIFNDFLNRDWYDWSNQNFSLTNTTIPSVNIKENENEFVVEMAAPGMTKEDFNIETQQQRVDNFVGEANKQPIERRRKRYPPRVQLPIVQPFVHLAGDSGNR
jgi:HSP20 family protein